MADKTESDPSLLVDLGLLDYREVYELQLELVERRRSSLLTRDVFLITEHPATFTLGRRGGREHLMVSESFLEEKHIPLVHIERGGDITYHGAGQLVIYPIISLRDCGYSVVDYVTRLEQVMIQLAHIYGVRAKRDHRNHGVWVAGQKLGSIGIAIRHGITYHGMALNVAVELEPFSWINPCGLTGVQMTSLQKITGLQLQLDEVKKQLEPILGDVFERRFRKLTGKKFFEGAIDG